MSSRSRWTHMAEEEYEAERSTIGDMGSLDTPSTSFRVAAGDGRGEATSSRSSRRFETRPRRAVLERCAQPDCGWPCRGGALRAAGALPAPSRRRTGRVPPLRRRGRLRGTTPSSGRGRAEMATGGQSPPVESSSAAFLRREACGSRRASRRLSACPSSWRTRSRVRSSSCPMASSVHGSPSKPNRSSRIRRSRSGRASSARVGCSGAGATPRPRRTGRPPRDRRRGHRARPRRPRRPSGSARPMRGRRRALRRHAGSGDPSPRRAPASSSRPSSTSSRRAARDSFCWRSTTCTGTRIVRA